ncbi:uncharacterized protein LOC5573311 [Aedes aegypti]|uniref:Uncharacterized protein n=1 Tax=Aedes aegypti TaxID=7159 RepID=A0A6I8TJ13_AEDAE|nr:uncharacterized protein LOC5573311 [Aedes aegypti]
MIEDDIEHEDFWQNIGRQLDDALLASIQKTGTAFTIFMHSLPNYNRAMVFEVIDIFKTKVLEPLMTIACEVITPVIPEQERASTLNNLMKITQAFDAVNTEHKFVKLLKEECHFQVPVLDQVNSELIPVETDGCVELIEKSKSNVYIGLERFFSTFFSIEANIEALLDNHQQIITASPEDLNDNFVKGKFWKQKTANRPGQICIPYFIFADSFEINNPLGSKAGKQALTGFYLNFPSLPRHINGTIENMFLIQFVYSAVEKSFSNEEILKTLIQEIIHLEKTPLKIRVKGEDRSVYFIFGGLRGDNLGLNSLLDYSRSFVANHPCRPQAMSREE